MHSESIAGIKISTPETELSRLLKANPTKGPMQLWEADGQFHQTWTYNGSGIKLGMVGASPKESKNVESIEIIAPCAFSTMKGIRIGSSESDVVRAYKDDYDEEESRKGQVVVAGSIYGGVIIEIKKNKVVKIFIGPSAE